LFCNEPETVHHLFFACVVAKQLWVMLTEFCHGIHVNSVKSLCEVWLLSDSSSSTISVAFLWALWKYRNDLSLQGIQRASLVMVWDCATLLLWKWAPLFKELRSRLLDRNLLLLDSKRKELLPIAWWGSRLMHRRQFLIDNT
jgi:hypothetical protein